MALARHFREADGLSVAQVGERLGRSPARIKAYFYDPSDANKKPTHNPRANAALGATRRSQVLVSELGDRWHLDDVARDRRAEQV